MRFLIDNQLPIALCRFLTARGAECLHVSEAGLTQVTDLEIWRRAGQAEQVLITKDADFVHLAGSVKTGARLVWVRLGNCRTAHLLAVFDHLWPLIEAALTAGDQTVEIWE
ncbi:MAG TPA: DUF5615 family PIN-like protein [Candidatus Acidoferrales bacterium]|nr:DUF5615 family PIN-like protein [Candidatus Acidoferrales bacterium]